MLARRDLRSSPLALALSRKFGPRRVTLERSFIRDSALLILAFGLASKAVLWMFGNDDIMRLGWFLLGPSIFLIIRHGYLTTVPVAIGVVFASYFQGWPPIELAVNMGRFVVVTSAGAWIYRRTGGQTLTFDQVADYLRLYGVGGLLGGLSMGGFLGLRFLSGQDVSAADALQHVGGAATGFVLTMLPLLVAREWRKSIPKRSTAWEGLVIIGLSFLFGQVIFLDWLHDSVGQVARGYWMFMFVTLAALRLGPGGVAS